MSDSDNSGADERAPQPYRFVPTGDQAKEQARLDVRSANAGGANAAGKSDAAADSVRPKPEAPKPTARPKPPRSRPSRPAARASSTPRASSGPGPTAARRRVTVALVAATVVGGLGFALTRPEPPLYQVRVLIAPKDPTAVNRIVGRLSNPANWDRAARAAGVAPAELGFNVPTAHSQSQASALLRSSRPDSLRNAGQALLDTATGDDPIERTSINGPINLNPQPRRAWLIAALLAVAAGVLGALLSGPRPRFIGVLLATIDPYLKPFGLDRYSRDQRQGSPRHGNR